MPRDIHKEAFENLLKETERGTVKIGFEGIFLSYGQQKYKYSIETKDSLMVGSVDELVKLLDDRKELYG